jgi:leucyl/phenylalanyl-tRNA---protein transferase
MRRIVFPSVETADDDGLVAIGGDLAADTLVEAYRQGIFPWPISVDLPLAWFSPDPRGILFVEDLHLSGSFKKFLRHHPYRITSNTAFDQVIKACAVTPRKGQPGTWITPGIVQGYQNLHRSGLAYSIEVWEEEELVAGLYGVSMGAFFSGESMFTRRTNASKLALYYLLQKLGDADIGWLDTQMVTSVVEQFGGGYIPRTDFLELLGSVDWNLDPGKILGVA